jgi:L-asparagine transporter-like permease
MSFRLLIVLLDMLAIAIFSHHWYMDIQIPAWSALIWCVAATLHDLEHYLETK